MDPIKEAFLKIKEEISSLKNDINMLKNDISDIQNLIQTNPTHIQSQNTNPTDNQTHIQTNPTQNIGLERPYNQNYDISTGNKGVPTDTQTDTQTIQQTQNTPEKEYFSEFKKASETLESLDNIKKGIRLKFKRLTPQEMLVFSHLYLLEEQKLDEITYKTLANKMKLTESSIRDYINRLISKGIPIEKTRQNNKTILLSISSDLKNIATLDTIQNLRSI